METDTSPSLQVSAGREKGKDKGHRPLKSTLLPLRSFPSILPNRFYFHLIGQSWPVATLLRDGMGVFAADHIAARNEIRILLAWRKGRLDTGQATWLESRHTPRHS